MYGIKKESVDGTEYYTRTFVASSATSTYKNNYSINLYLENAPEGTIVTNPDNEKLKSWSTADRLYWIVPTPKNERTDMNENGSEYAGDFKVCIPVRNTPKSGNITFHANATITQFGIYFANNTTETEQSFVIADPQYAPMSCTGTMKWDTVTSPYGRLVVNKIDGMGNPLQGALFKLTGSNGKTYERTSDSTGQIVWEYLDPTITYTLSEMQAPAGYIKAENVTVNVLAGTTTTVSVKNYSERMLRIRKVDAQNGNPLIGASFRIEQTDGSYKTDLYTGHNGCIELQGDVLRTVKQHPPVQHDASAVRLYNACNAPQCHAFAAAGSAQQGGGGVAGGKGSTEGEAVQLFFNVDFKAHFRPPAFCFFSSRFTASSTTAEIAISTSTHRMAPSSSLVRHSW